MLTESLSKENNFTEEKQHFDQTLYWSIQHTQGRTHTHCHCRTAKFSQTECTWVASTVISSQNLLLPQTPVWLLTVQNGLLCVRIFNERHNLGWTRLLLTSFNQYYIYYPSILSHIRWDILRNALVQWVYTNWFLTSLLVVIWQWTLGRGRAASKGSKKIAGNREVVMLTKVIIAEERCNDWIPDRVCV